MPAEDMTITAAWRAEEYRITYVLDGGVNAAGNPEVYTIETETITLANASRTGYTFGGWYSDSEYETQVSQIVKGSTGDVTLYAKWTTDPYTISYELNGGTATNPTAYSIETETFTLNNPTREGYTFAGWTGTGLDEAAQTVTIEKGSTGNREYTAMWTVNRYSITFDTAGGSEVSAVTADFGSALTAPEEPVKEGYTFIGWDPAFPETMPAADMTLTAVWKAKGNIPYTVEHYFEKLDGEYDVITVHQTGVTDETVTATTLGRNGFIFDAEIEGTVAEGVVTADGKLVLKLFYTRESYTITFVDEDGTVLQTGSVKYEAMPAYTGAEPEKEATADVFYTFAGWEPGIEEASKAAVYTAEYESSEQIYAFTNWNWTGSDTEGYTAAEAVFKAGVGDFSRKVQAELTVNTTAATCETDGKTVYTASAVFEDKTYTDARETVIPATGHAYGEPEYVWAEDFSKVTASVVCANDESHVITETAAASYEVTKEPTQTETGTGVYTAVFENGLFTEQKQEVEIPVIEKLELLLKNTPNGVNVSWNTTAGAEKFRLERKKAKESWTVISDALTETSYLDGNIYQKNGNVRMGETYSYRVSAFKDGDWNEVSEEESILYNPFTDVTEGNNTFTYISWAYNNQIIKGVDDGSKFDPAGGCTRLNFVMMLWKMTGQKTVNAENPFTDVTGAKSNKAVMWAYSEGITVGTSKTTFSPDDLVTRAQIVMMLWKMAGKPKASVENPFTDVPGAKTLSAVLWAYENKITVGTGDGTTFSPDITCTRAQLVTFLYKYNRKYHVI